MNVYPATVLHSLPNKLVSAELRRADCSGIKQSQIRLGRIWQAKKGSAAQSLAFQGTYRPEE